MRKSFLYLINTFSNMVENILCFLTVGHPIKFLLKGMQHSALKPCFFFPCLASGKRRFRSSLKTLCSVKVYNVLIDATWNKLNKMGSTVLNSR